MKSQDLRAELGDRYELAALAAQVEEAQPLPVLSVWLLARLAEVGLETGDDLALLGPEDLMPEPPSDETAAVIKKRFRRTLNIGDARYEIEYQVAERKAIFHQVHGSRRQPPSPIHLPSLPGFRLYWEYKNRVQAISSR